MQERPKPKNSVIHLSFELSIFISFANSPIKCDKPRMKRQTANGKRQWVLHFITSPRLTSGIKDKSVITASDYRLPFDVCRFPSAVFRLPSAVVHCSPSLLSFAAV
jgi:hypothetical protein